MKRIIGIVLLLLAVTGVVSLSLKEYRLALFGERGTGVVTKVETVTTSTASDGYYRNGRLRGKKYGSDLTFLHLDFATPDGREQHVKTLATFNTAARVGDAQPVIYLPSQPENAKIYSARQLWLPMVVGTVFSAGCALGGLKLVRRRTV